MKPRTRKLGENRCQCASCGEHFNSTAAFDKHRSQGRCLTADEMLGKGMAINSSGWWVTSAWEMPFPASTQPRISASDAIG